MILSVGYKMKNKDFVHKRMPGNSWQVEHSTSASGGPTWSPCSNVMASKTRVAPIKGQRLELLGATYNSLLSRLVNTILKSLPVRPQVHCWTDSMTVLCWIKNQPHWKQYVQIRATEIRQFTGESWRFVQDWRTCHPDHVQPVY